MVEKLNEKKNPIFTESAAMPSHSVNIRDKKKKKILSMICWFVDGNANGIHIHRYIHFVTNVASPS